MAPFAADGGPVGVLVLHGFTGSPRTVRAWAGYLAQAGLTVRVPLLAGHGGTWQQLAKTGWADWQRSAEDALTELSARCQQVFIAAISMGGALAFRLAQTHPDQVAGLVLVNPSLAGDNRLIPLAPALKYLIRSLPSIGGDIKDPGAQEGAAKRTPVASVATMPRMWKTVRNELASVTAPVLVYRSTVDHVVGPASMKVLTAALPGAEIRPLANSYHVATLDYDAPEIFAGTLAFINQHKHSVTQHSEAEKKRV